MTRRLEFAYTQARLGARHGDRLSPEDWQYLRTNRSLGLYLNKASSTSLSRWTQQLHANMKHNAIERLLRASWRDYVVELAGWPPAKWRAPILSWSHLPDLPILDHILRGGPVPSWIRRDPELHPLARLDPGARSHSIVPAELDFMATANDSSLSMRERWTHHFEHLWPADERLYLHRLSKPLRHLGDVGEQRDGEDAVNDWWAELDHVLTRMFRDHQQTPLAIFAHLGLVAIDMLRLRGDLLMRCLFPNKPAGGQSWR